MGDDPIVQMQKWLDEAIQAGVEEPNAMCLATVGKDMKPSNRYVLLKGLDQRGLTFFTNYESKKSLQMVENPNVAVTFWWTLMERSVRVEGKVSKITDKENDDYYNSRCYGAKIGAWVSD